VPGHSAPAQRYATRQPTQNALSLASFASKYSLLVRPSSNYVSMCDSHWEALRLGPERARCDGKQVGGLWAHADLNGLLRFLARRVLRGDVFVDSASPVPTLGTWWHIVVGAFLAETQASYVAHSLLVSRGCAKPFRPSSRMVLLAKSKCNFDSPCVPWPLVSRARSWALAVRRMSTIPQH